MKWLRHGVFRSLLGWTAILLLGAIVVSDRVWRFVLIAAALLVAPLVTISVLRKPGAGMNGRQSGRD